MLTWVTCHPLRATGEAPERFVVQAKPEEVRDFNQAVI